MFPIRDHNPSGRTPYVTYALIAANILVFLSYANLLGNERALWSFFTDWAIIPPIEAPTRCADSIPSRSINPSVSAAMSRSFWPTRGSSIAACASG